MKTLSAFSFKTAISAGLALTLLGTVAGCAVVDPGYGITQYMVVTAITAMLTINALARL